MRVLSTKLAYRFLFISLLFLVCNPDDKVNIVYPEGGKSPNGASQGTIIGPDSYRDTNAGHIIFPLIKKKFRKSQF